MSSTHEIARPSIFGPPSCAIRAAILGFTFLTASVAPAFASAPDRWEVAFSDGAAFTPMTRAEMAEQRGGFDGVAFGIFLSGTLNQPTPATLPAGLSVSTVAPGQVQIVGGVGDLAGASGIFQFTNIVGDMNVVNNNIIINVSIQPASPTNTVSGLI